MSHYFQKDLGLNVPFWRLTAGATAIAISCSLLLASPVLAQKPASEVSEGQPVSSAMIPKPGQIRMNLSLSGRDVAFLGELQPAARGIIAFEEGEFAIEPQTRTAVAAFSAKLAESGKGKTMVIIAYGADEAIAYRRARAVRGELIERHQFDAAKLVAAGRAAPDHTRGATVVDAYSVDPASCQGCGAATFRSLAYDSGTVRLVTAVPEGIAGQAEKQAGLVEEKPTQSEPTPSKPTPSKLVQEKPVTRPTSPKQAASSVPAPAPSNEAATPHRAKKVLRQAGAKPDIGGKDYVPPNVVKRHAGGRMADSSACPRPRIIIDDYYPGGPLVPCSKASRR